jgi:hypothetical protein
LRARGRPPTVMRQPNQSTRAAGVKMPIAARAAPILAVLALVACSTGPPSGSVSPSANTSPSESPSPSAEPTTFTSETYGYSLTLPGGWVPVQASAVWDGKGSPGSDDAVADQFIGPTAASSWAFAAPTTRDLAAYVKGTIKGTVEDHGDTCPATPDAQDPIELGGQPGRLLAWNCGILINQAVTVKNGVGYFFGFRDPSVKAATDATDRELFLELLRSVQFSD